MTWEKLFENKIAYVDLWTLEMIFDNWARRSVYLWYRIDKHFQTDMKTLAEERKRERMPEIDFD